MIISTCLGLWWTSSETTDIYTAKCGGNWRSCLYLGLLFPGDGHS